MGIYHIIQKSMENSEMALNQTYETPVLIYGSLYNSHFFVTRKITVQFWPHPSVVQTLTIPNKVFLKCTHLNESDLKVSAWSRHYF